MQVSQPPQSPQIPVITLTAPIVKPEVLSAPVVKVEVSSPKVKVSSQKVEASSQKVQVSSKKVEASSQKVQVSSKKVEASSQKVEASSQKVQVSSKKVEASSQKVQVSSKKQPRTKRCLIDYMPESSQEKVKLLSLPKQPTLSHPTKQVSYELRVENLLEKDLKARKEFNQKTLNRLEDIQSLIEDQTQQHKLFTDAFIHHVAFMRERLERLDKERESKG